MATSKKFLIPAILTFVVATAGLLVLFRGVSYPRSKASAKLQPPLPTAPPITVPEVVEVLKAPEIIPPARPVVPLSPEQSNLTWSVGDEARWRDSVNLLEAFVEKSGKSPSVQDVLPRAFAPASRVELLCLSDKKDAEGNVTFLTDTDYDLRVAFERIQGKGGLELTMCLNRKHFHWVLGGPDNTASGFEFVDGRKLASNSTLVKKPEWIETGRKYETIVQVRRGGIRAFLDGKLVSDWGDLVRLSQGRGPHFDAGTIGLTLFAEINIHAIQLRPYDRTKGAEAISSNPTEKYGSEMQHEHRR